MCGRVPDGPARAQRLSPLLSSVHSQNDALLKHQLQKLEKRGRRKPGSAELDEAEAEPGGAEPGRAELDEVGRSLEGRSQTGWGRARGAEPSRAELGEAERSRRGGMKQGREEPEGRDWKGWGGARGVWQRQRGGATRGGAGPSRAEPDGVGRSPGRRGASLLRRVRQERETPATELPVGDCAETPHIQTRGPSLQSPPRVWPELSVLPSIPAPLWSADGQQRAWVWSRQR